MFEPNYQAKMTPHIVELGKQLNDACVRNHLTRGTQFIMPGVLWARPAANYPFFFNRITEQYPELGPGDWFPVLSDAATLGVLEDLVVAGRPYTIGVDKDGRTKLTLALGEALVFYGNSKASALVKAYCYGFLQEDAAKVATTP